jgi:hypothetical protein
MGMKTEKPLSLATQLSQLSPDQLKAVVTELITIAPESSKLLALLASAKDYRPYLAPPSYYPPYRWPYSDIVYLNTTGSTNPLQVKTTPTITWNPSLEHKDTGINNYLDSTLLFKTTTTQDGITISC